MIHDTLNHWLSRHYPGLWAVVPSTSPERFTIGLGSFYVPENRDWLYIARKGVDPLIHYLIRIPIDEEFYTTFKRFVDAVLLPLKGKPKFSLGITPDELHLILAFRHRGAPTGWNYVVYQRHSSGQTEQVIDLQCESWFRATSMNMRSLGDPVTYGQGTATIKENVPPNHLGIFRVVDGRLFIVFRKHPEKEG